jgi:tetratricopeptide (TPR) repeat protein
MTAKSNGLALAAIMALATAGAARADCKFEKIAEVPVTMEGLRPTIMAQINGQDARLAVSTGAFFSGVNPETAAKYGMKHAAAPFGMEVRGIGGATRDVQAVSAETFSFAGMGFRRSEFLLADRIGGGQIAGDIGENMMGAFDVEYDFAHGVMRYFKAQGCGYGTNLAYWSQGQAVSRLSLIEPTTILSKVIANAKVDGHLIRVSFNSNGVSILSRPAAARAGIQINSADVVRAGVTYGMYGKGIEEFLAPFASFAIGDEEIKNTRLRIADLDLPNTDMVLGADFFLSHRILISNSQKRVYFTYNGGPVFRLEQGAKQLAQAGAAPGAIPAAPPAAGGDDPKSGADFARRAAAEAARRELQPAIADYGKAIELEPDNGAHYRARAMVRLAARQPVLAMADLDESLKRRPDDPEALMRRGELYLATKDPIRAKADFDAAMKLAPDQAVLISQAGAAYTRAGLYEEAVQELDRWIAAHPKSENLPRAQNARCLARAAWGKDLDKALADCDAAVRRDKTSATMGNRGLVLLRLGRLDDAIAQYGEAIRAQPRDAAALYGRGLAELKKGQKAAGDADIAAATAIAPQAGEPYKRFGLAFDAPAGAAAKS